MVPRPLEKLGVDSPLCPHHPLKKNPNLPNWALTMDLVNLNNNWALTKNPIRHK